MGEPRQLGPAPEPPEDGRRQWVVFRVQGSIPIRLVEVARVYAGTEEAALASAAERAIGGQLVALPLEQAHGRRVRYAVVPLIE